MARITLWAICLSVASATGGWVAGITMASPSYDIREVVVVVRPKVLSARTFNTICHMVPKELYR